MKAFTSTLGPRWTQPNHIKCKVRPPEEPFLSLRTHLAFVGHPQLPHATHRPRISCLVAFFPCGDVARSAVPAHAAVLVATTVSSAQLVPVPIAATTAAPAPAPLPVFGPDDISTAIEVIKRAGAGSASEGWRRILK